MLKDRKLLILPTPPLFDAPAIGENPSEFLDETYPAETRGMGLTVWWKFHNPNFNRFLRYTRLTDGQTDRQTDGRAIAYTRYSAIYIYYEIVLTGYKEK